MNRIVPEEKMLKTDCLTLAEQSNDNIVVTISGRKMFFTIELLVSMRDRGIDTTADNLFFYCHKLGAEIDGLQDEPSINFVSRSLTQDQAMAC